MTREWEFREDNDSTSDKVTIKLEGKYLVELFQDSGQLEGKIIQNSQTVCKVYETELVYHFTTTNLKLHVVNMHPAGTKSVKSAFQTSETDRLVAFFRALICTEFEFSFTC